MSIPSRSQVILLKINEFYRINFDDTNERIKFAVHKLIHQWSEILEAGYDAIDDDLFSLNISRAFLTKIFGIALFKDCFNDHTFTQDIYYTCFNLLINYIDIFTKKQLTSIDIFLRSNIILIMDLVSHITSFLWYTDIEILNQDNIYQLFLIIREYVDQDINHDNLTDSILSFIWNVSDNTLFVPIFLKANYAKSLLEWIKICQKKFRDDKYHVLINILLNMIRHDDGIEEFNQFHALDIIEQIEISSNISLSIEMIRVLLTDIHQIKFESIEFLNQLIQLIINASKNEKYRYDGSHVSEPLTILTKLVFNQEILHIILNKISIKLSIIIELFISLLMKFYSKLDSNNDPAENFTCVLILNIFLCISFYQEYSYILYDNEQLMNIIKNIANNKNIFLHTFMPRTMKNIQQAAIDILKNQNNFNLLRNENS